MTNMSSTIESRQMFIANQCLLSKCQLRSNQAFMKLPFIMILLDWKFVKRQKLKQSAVKAQTIQGVSKNVVLAIYFPPRHYKNDRPRDDGTLRHV